MRVQQATGVAKAMEWATFRKKGFFDGLAVCRHSASYPDITEHCAHRIQVPECRIARTEAEVLHIMGLTTSMLGRNRLVQIHADCVKSCDPWPNFKAHCKKKKKKKCIYVLI